MKKLLIIPIIFLFACAMPTIPTVNVSDELKQIVYADETSQEQGGEWMLMLEAEMPGVIYISAITVKGESVRVDYLTTSVNGYATGWLKDNDGDGKIDEWLETINNTIMPITSKESQQHYESYLEFARYVSENGVINEPENKTEDV